MVNIVSLPMQPKKKHVKFERFLNPSVLTALCFEKAQKPTWMYIDPTDGSLADRFTGSWLFNTKTHPIDGKLVTNPFISWKCVCVCVFLPNIQCLFSLCPSIHPSIPTTKCIWSTRKNLVHQTQGWQKQKKNMEKVHEGVKCPERIWSAVTRHVNQIYGLHIQWPGRFHQETLEERDCHGHILNVDDHRSVPAFRGFADFSVKCKGLEKDLVQLLVEEIRRTSWGW